MCPGEVMGSHSPRGLFGVIGISHIFDGRGGGHWSIQPVWQEEISSKSSWVSGEWMREEGRTA